jgi:hypothetical protein
MGRSQFAHRAGKKILLPGFDRELIGTIALESGEGRQKPD